MASAAPTKVIDIGRVISRGFSALGANFLPFFAFAVLLVGAPTGFMQYWVWSQIQSAAAIDQAFMFAYLGGAMGAMLLSLVGGTILQGVVVRSTVLFLSGREPDLATSVAVALRLLFPILAISIIVGVLIVLGLFALIVPGIIVYCAYIVSVPALIEERRGIFGSMQRSRDLTRGSRGLIFLLGIAFWVFGVVIGGVAELIGGGSSMQFDLAELPDPLRYGVSTGLGAALTSVIVAVSLAALYVELRTVKEGTTTDELAEVFA